jgi:hypothetical protein
MTAILTWICAFGLVATSVGLLISRDWRWSLGLLAAQYLAAFGLILVYWPLTMSAAKLVTGWMAAAVLGMTQSGLSTSLSDEGSWPEGRLFRLLSAGLLVVTISAIGPGLADWLPGASLPVIWGALVLVAMGLLQLGMTLHPFRVILGLLTTLLGFEIIAATLENSILVAGLLAVITLGLGLAGAYLLAANAAEEPA